MPTVSHYMAEAERADGVYQQAVVGAAQARADYELAYFKALAGCPLKAVSARKEYAEAEACDQHQVWLIAEAQEKAARTHVNVVLGLMVAAQSQQKFAGKQDGGTNWGEDW